MKRSGEGLTEHAIVNKIISIVWFLIGKEIKISEANNFVGKSFPRLKLVKRQKIGMLSDG